MPKVILRIRDGTCLISATTNPGGDDPYYYNEFDYRQDDLVEIELPEDLAIKMVLQGTDRQFFEDGEKALEAIKEFVL